VAGLREVVIVAGDPEERDNRATPLLFQHRGQRGGRQGLVNGVERPGEQRRLLSRSHHQDAGRLEPTAERLVTRRGHDGRQQRGIETSDPGLRLGERRLQRGRHDP
jgi:hypothetical protein